MIRLILFLKRIYFPLLFVILECLAFGYYQNSSMYSNAKIMNASTAVVGGVYDRMSQIRHYFGLRKENENLLAQVVELQNRLHASQFKESYPVDSTILTVDSIVSSADTVGEMYLYSAARVINNSISKQQNYITIDKGRRDAIEKDMALVADGSIVGYVLDCSDRFAVVISLLNTNFKTSGKIKNEEYFGSIFWDGTAYDEVTFSEIPKYAQLTVGDTIETTNYSSIFPPKLMIGTIASFEMINGTYYQAKVKLKLDMGKLKYVTPVRYVDQSERMKLEQQVTGEVSR